MGFLKKNIMNKQSVSSSSGHFQNMDRFEPVGCQRQEPDDEADATRRPLSRGCHVVRPPLDRRRQTLAAGVSGGDPTPLPRPPPLQARRHP